MSYVLTSRTQYHVELLQQLQQRLQKASEVVPAATLEALEEIIVALQHQQPHAHELGQDWLSTLATHQPQLVPAIERDLFWFFGGSCLHTLTDEEIESFQQLDEQADEAEQAGQAFDRTAVRKALLSR